MWRSGFLVAGLLASTQVSADSISPDLSGVANLAPVQSVNSRTGSVLLPTLQRQVSSPLDISSGTATWTFPAAFSALPTCFESIASSNTSYVFAQPVTAAISQSAVTVTEQAAAKVLTISLGLTTIWGAPPAGTTITLSCIATLS